MTITPPRSLIIALLVLLAGVACEPTTSNPLGSELDDREQEVYTLIIEPDVDWVDTGYYGYSNTDGSIKLAVGRVDDTIVRSLIEFDLDDLPGEVDADNLERAYVQYYYTRGYSVANWRPINRGELRVDVHALGADWVDEEADWLYRSADHRWDSQGGDFGPTYSSFVLEELETGDAETRRFEVTQLVLDWLADPDAYHGLLLKAADEAGASCVKEFYSDDLQASDNRPYLLVVYESSDGEKREARIQAEQDVHIARNTADGGSGYSYGADPELELGIAYGSSRRLVFDFALQELPDEATINLARLELYSSFPDRAYEQTLYLQHLLEDVDEGYTQEQLRAAELADDDEGIYGRDITGAPGGYYDFQIAPIVQDWLAGDYEQHGLVLRLGHTLDYAQSIRVATSQTPYENRRPRLVIKYTLPPGYWSTAPVGTHTVLD
ncbi:MAG: DNRLRE domain-containing protein [Candidatus Coatesbacteria bacterium]|nr:DNRLRE domain-containing protein [Candidatus Coatesbacteria bacterium]